MRKACSLLILLSSIATFAAVGTSKNTVTGNKIKDATGQEVVQTVVKGPLAQIIFETLNVRSYVIPGQAGEQTTKDARGVTCGHFHETNYFCAIDFDAAGVSQ